MPSRVTASPAAASVLRRLRQEHGDLMFHLSNGCCDGTAPLCLRQDEFRLGAQDVLLGDIEGTPFYTSATVAQWLAGAQVAIDVVEGGSDSFSLEAGDGVRFVARTITGARGIPNPKE